MDLINSHQFTIPDGRPYKVAKSGVHFHPDTAPNVAQAIDVLIRSGRKVRVFLGDTTTGKVWAEEHDCHGTLSTSTGALRVPLLITPGADGGPHMLDHCVVGILTAKGVWAYRHPSMDMGTWSIRPCSITGDNKVRYVAETLHNGEVHGRHRTKASAERLVAFMTGERMAP